MKKKKEWGAADAVFSARCMMKNKETTMMHLLMGRRRRRTMTSLLLLHGLMRRRPIMSVAAEEEEKKPQLTVVEGDSALRRRRIDAQNRTLSFSGNPPPRREGRTHENWCHTALFILIPRKCSFLPSSLQERSANSLTARRARTTNLKFAAAAARFDTKPSPREGGREEEGAGSRAANSHRG